ncbi:hypothetical protein M422DRAFT_247109 [Sphaerobolus stellatus SS14]|nr:hypothetical protein M422DRAFT_247109 [Sphaerobolus stellatus SS14]
MSPRPILISGTCKKEDAQRHSVLLQTALKACKQEGEQLGCSMYSIATDSERKRGKALWSLTMKNTLDASSPIYRFLGHLPLLNQNVGDHDETLDKDYRHIGKQARNTSIRAKGIDMCGITITPPILEHHLLDSGIAASRVQSLLQLNNKQDVPLAYGFLATIAKLAPPEQGKSATYIQACRALNVLGEFWMALITPYTDCAMSLRQQLMNLSKAAHICLALYIMSKDAFIPVQLYGDIQHMIKNVFFCVAKAKVHDPQGKFYIILLGTDHLKVLFGLIHSMIGNDANADLL